MRADTDDVAAKSDRDLGERLAGLADADLVGLRLAAQVLGHKAAIAGRPLVATYFSDLGRLADFQLAQRGVGFVVGAPPTLALDGRANADDRQLARAHLDLLVDNPQLAAALRDVCAALRLRLAD